MDSLSVAYGIFQRSYAAVREICARNGVYSSEAVTVETMNPSVFQRDIFRTPDPLPVTEYGLVQTAGTFATTALKDPRDDEFHDILSPTNEEIADAFESKRISAAEHVLVTNPALAASITQSKEQLSANDLLVKSQHCFSNLATEQQAVTYASPQVRKPAKDRFGSPVYKKDDDGCITSPRRE
ncbi:hypothetical protein GMRT_11718 [Giardia muris]|uniref:Uncharacterized protein n=1 Tax=Giardia muris TaxID=5742 RepID=A0A4Z1T1B8_GIAMU|nr:hypothetical protein GMRT_11718 [Giardia muris]|eukprot:TNJ26727.1 hypothetical protein GMRT_11718 [Giardia muris]